MSSSTPQEVLDAIAKLGSADQEILKSYICKLEGSEPQKSGDGDSPPLYSGTMEDFDKASAAKSEAQSLKSEGKWQEAMDKYTEAILAAPPSPLLMADRALMLFKLERYKAALVDCNEALKMNPDSAKALRVRGKVRKALDDCTGAREDLSQAQQIDFDENTVQDLKEVTELCKELEKEKVQKKLEEEEKRRKKLEEIKRAKEEQQRSEERAAGGAGMGGGMPGMGGFPGMGGMGGMPGMGGMGGMPGMGGMGGMPGMGGMGDILQTIMSDPELASAMQNPKVISALQGVMSGGGMNPAKIQELMGDPEVGPVLKKLMSKIGGGAMGGMPGMGGGAGRGADADDMPDLEEMPNL